MESGLSRAPRHNVRLMASASRDDGRETPTIVTNFSLTGCGLIGHFRGGERIVLAIPRIGTFTADIRWAANGQAGARFVSRIQRQLDSSGAAAIEYALLAALIALAIVAALTGVGAEISNEFNSVNQALPGGTDFQV